MFLVSIKLKKILTALLTKKKKTNGQNSISNYKETVVVTLHTLRYKIHKYLTQRVLQKTVYSVSVYLIAHHGFFIKCCPIADSHAA